MDLSVAFFAAAVPAVIFAGISKGGFGSGAAFASTPFLAVILDPTQAVALMLPLLMIMDVTALRAWWGRWDRTEARNLILGGLIGVGVATGLFTRIGEDTVRLLIGGIALGFVAFQLWGRRLLTSGDRPPMGTGQGLFWGTVCGFTSFISHAGGPPATVYLLGRGLAKTPFQGTTVIVFAAINAAKFVAYLWLGLFSAQTATAVVALAPVAILGTWIGVVAHRHVPERAFFAAIYVFLTVTGAKLVWDGLS